MRSARQFALAVLAALCPGCALFVSVPPLTPLPKPRAVLRDVAYTPQETDWDCGPASLTTVMRYYGSRITLPEVKKQLKRAADGGTIVVEMLYGARKNGFPIRMYEGGINDLRGKVLDGKPLILMLRPMPDIPGLPGRRRAHYVVAVGYDDREREAIIHSDKTAFARMSYRQLQLQWRRTKFLTLLVGRRPTRPAER